MTLRPKVIVFDFDYTLADSSKPVIECVSYALSGVGLPAASDDDIRRTIGLSLPESLARLTGPQDQGTMDRFFELFVHRADDVMVGGTVLLEPTRAAVGELKRRGLGLAIVSSKYRFRIEDILEREGLLDAFDTIGGGEDVAEMKPDPSGLLEAIERLKSTAVGALYVGDSETDAETAMRAEVPFVAVLSGVTPKAHLRRYPHIAILQDVSELPTLLTGPRTPPVPSPFGGRLGRGAAHPVVSPELGKQE